MQTYLGLDSKKELREASKLIAGIQVGVLKDLSFLKVQIEEDFALDKIRINTLLNTLGYTAHWLAVRQNNQQALIQLLYKYYQGLTPAVKEKLVNKEISSSLVDQIAGYAEVLRQSNINQEMIKGVNKPIAEAGNQDFNALYDQIMSICQICSKLFEDNAQIRSKFVFSLIVKSISTQRKADMVEQVIAPAA
jgi:hypothetical protein